MTQFRCTFIPPVTLVRCRYSNLPLRWISGRTYLQFPQRNCIPVDGLEPPMLLHVICSILKDKQLKQINLKKLNLIMGQRTLTKLGSLEFHIVDEHTWNSP